MKKFDLYTELVNLGFESKEDQWGGELLIKNYTKMVEVVWHGTMESKMTIEVRFSSDRGTVQAYYYDGYRRLFKQKVHLNDKRAFNAIRQTAENKGFEL